MQIIKHSRKGYESALIIYKCGTGRIYAVKVVGEAFRSYRKKSNSILDLYWHKVVGKI